MPAYDARLFGSRGVGAMRITTRNAAIACAAISLLGLLGYWIYQPAADEQFQDANGDPLLPMPFHSAGVDANIKIIDAKVLLMEFQKDKDKARQNFTNNGPGVQLPGCGGFSRCQA